MSCLSQLIHSVTIVLDEPQTTSWEFNTDEVNAFLVGGMGTSSREILASYWDTKE